MHLHRQKIIPRTSTSTRIGTPIRANPISAHAQPLIALRATLQAIEQQF